VGQAQEWGHWKAQESAHWKAAAQLICTRTALQRAVMEGSLPGTTHIALISTSHVRGLSPEHPSTCSRSLELPGSFIDASEQAGREITAFTSKHLGTPSWAVTAQISFLGLAGMWTPDCPQISSLLECFWVDLHPLPLPAASSSPPCVSPSVDSASSLMTLIIQLFSGHT